jgi:predicted membrane metal-binding protein
MASSVVVVPVAAYLVLYIFGGFSYIPVSVAVAVAVVIFLFRSRGVKRKLPKPHGEGREEIVSAAQMARTGLLMIVGGIVLVVLPLATIFFLPVLFFILYLALALAIPLTEMLQFAWIARLEKKVGAEIYSITEETEVDGKDAVMKRIVFLPRDRLS